MNKAHHNHSQMFESGKLSFGFRDTLLRELHNSSNFRSRETEPSHHNVKQPVRFLITECQFVTIEETGPEID
jgi:hypothetical protein